MSVSVTDAVQQEIQNELIIANQLLQQISSELQEIKQLTGPGGTFETNIKENASLMTTLANLLNLDLKNLPSILKRQPEWESQNVEHMELNESSNADVS